MMSSIPERFDNYILFALSAFTALATGLVGWLVRRMFTNQKQIEELKLEVKVRSAQRELEMSMLTRLERELAALRADVTMLNRNYRKDDTDG